MGKANNDSLDIRGGMRKKWLVHLFPLPAVAIYTIFIVYPILAAFTYSLFEWKGLVMGGFNQFENYKRLFMEEPYNTMFWNALSHNVYYFMIEMLVQNTIAFALAYVIYKKIKGVSFFKVAYFLPRLLSIIVVGFLWKLILNPNIGVLNATLRAVGLDSWATAWLGNPDTALTAIALINSWFAIGFYMLILLAGLQSISVEVLEAAKLDGATGLKLIRSVVLPMMFQPLVIVIVMTFIQSFEAFELVFAMQGSMGEPYYSTDLLAVFFYRTAFGTSGGDAGSLGIGSALAVVMFVIIATISALFMRYVNKREQT
ncbi:sugar ABC transporter permease [Cohnella sp. LGH]|uniref:Carbohydrate ABC transporter membrane protein 1 (CUT1 family) n=1 Tax=Cohnella phaseoli TaxID=456490 RepID=A0A3D9INL8_9BACL|nr:MULTISPECIES: sugar ABC transporter permease [Cohnella]QTH41246.1 sugar ABC transporter permease [Cohnella sp. LGH]RED63331.1 carbohydrate ABC transporter membrane protein 1 (CUT1 family) [Cohnella phaseoli]